MKKMLMMAAAPLMIALAVLMIGCASTKGFLGLTTVSTMEAELAQIREEEDRRHQELRQELERISRELSSLNAEVDRHEELSGEIRQVLEDFAEVQKATSDLQQLAEQVEDELDAIPRETLQQIVDVLQAYLDRMEQP
jgi:predicted nuclease with TOPRIM domain